MRRPRRLRKISTKVKKAIADLRSNASSISCASCGRGRVCDSGYADDRIVANGGHCISKFKLLYDFASALTLAYYTQYAPVFRAARRPEPVFATRFHLDGAPHDIPSPVFVGGATSYVERGQSAYSEVGLAFYIPSFDWKSMLAIFYVLLHELACHAYSGVYPNGPLGRKDPVEYDIFAEGWMDMVVSVILDDLREHQGPACSLAPPLELLRYVAEGLEFQGVRRDCRRPDRSQTASLIALGYTAAEAVKGVFERFAGDVARDIFLEFSFAYNLLRSPVRERNAVVNKLAEKLKVADSPAYRRCARPLVQYARNRDLTALLAKLTTL